ncbi:MAG TPA: PHP domain-containing protein, partial [Microlunatus sp.]|nr:PHP domain-containing protein [Microlunatus sp.]
MRIDLHTHSAVSDGTDTPAELVAKAAAAGLDVVALTDHDTYAGLDEAVEAGTQHGVEVLRGVELSTRFGSQSVHLLAYGPDERHPGLEQEMSRIRDGRSMRLAPVLDRLAALGLTLTEEQVMRHVGGSPSVGRPHIADALVEAGYVADRREAFDRYLADGGPAHVPRYAVELSRAVDLVHDAGGVAVIAHPWGRGRDRELTEAVISRLVREHGLDGLEVDHQDHDLETRSRLHRLAERLDVIATGSSDFHGVGKVG